MNDAMKYTEMLDMEVSSCDVIVRPKRKKRKDGKERVIALVNGADENKDEEKKDEKPENEKRKNKKFKFDFVYAEGVAVFLLVVGILLTNIFWADSGINTVFKKAFGVQNESVDDRTYLSFSAKSPSSELAIKIEEGVMTFSGKGTMYPVCDGTVSMVENVDGKYRLTITHSDTFKTVVDGLQYSYVEKGDAVYKYIPIGYVDGQNATVSMFEKDSLLTNYIVEDGNVIWEV